MDGRHYSRFILFRAIKLKKAFILFFIFYCIQVNITFGQLIDSLDEVLISSTGIQPNQISLLKTDSNTLLMYNAQSLDNLLQQQQAIYIRNYGLSSLSTLSLRGSSSSQTSILWNGMNIQNAMLGLSDLSILPTSFFNTVAVDYGGSQFTIGGSLLLNNKIHFTEKKQKHISLLSMYESFKNHHSSVHFSCSNQRIFFEAKNYIGFGKNSYSYYNFYNDKEEKIGNNPSLQYQSMFSAAYKYRKNIFSFHYWYIHNQRAIPPTSFETISKKDEKNNHHRLVFHHETKGRHYQWTQFIGYQNEIMHFNDSMIHLFFNAKSYRLPINSKFQYFIHHNTSLAVTSSFENMGMDNVIEKNTLNEFRTQLQWNQDSVFHTNLHFQASGQWSKNTLFKIPLQYLLQTNYYFQKSNLVFLKFYSSFRTPTLNELFYFPGGNKNLQPEAAKGFELGWLFQKQNKKSTWSFRNYVYARLVENWIVWNGAALLFPSNVAEVKNMGWESNSQHDIYFDKMHLQSKLFFNINSATQYKKRFQNDLSYGKQIPYVPLFNLSWSEWLFWKNNTLMLNFQYTSTRFASTDNIIRVAPFYLFNLSYSRDMQFKLHHFRLQTQLNNALNKNYESVRGRIMPGRNFSISLLWSI